MNIKEIVEHAITKSRFQTLDGYIDFCRIYLNFVSKHLQAKIVSQNENHYNFFQYDEEGAFQITRPINTKLFYEADKFELIFKEYKRILASCRDLSSEDTVSREILNNVTYTIQQSIGAALDGLPIGAS